MEISYIITFFLLFKFMFFYDWLHHTFVKEIPPIAVRHAYACIDNKLFWYYVLRLHISRSKQSNFAFPLVEIFMEKAKVWWFDLRSVSEVSQTFGFWRQGTLYLTAQNRWDWKPFNSSASSDLSVWMRWKNIKMICFCWFYFYFLHTPTNNVT